MKQFTKTVGTVKSARNLTLFREIAQDFKTDLRLDFSIHLRMPNYTSFSFDASSSA